MTLTLIQFVADAFFVTFVGVLGEQIMLDISCESYDNSREISSISRRFHKIDGLLHSLLVLVDKENV